MTRAFVCTFDFRDLRDFICTMSGPQNVGSSQNGGFHFIAQNTVLIPLTKLYLSDDWVTVQKTLIRKLDLKCTVFLRNKIYAISISILCISQEELAKPNRQIYDFYK